MKKTLSLGDAPAALAPPVPPVLGPSAPPVLRQPLPVRDALPDVLRRALARLDAAPDLATAARLVDVCVPVLADSAVVHLLDGPFHGDDPIALPPGSRLLVRSPLGGAGAGWGPAQVVPARSVLREAIESRRHVHRSAPLPAPAAAATSDDETVAVPLLCGGLPLGVLVLRRDPRRPRWSAEDITAVEQLAALTALRLDHLRLSALRAATGTALRGALLPAVSRALTAVDVGFRHRTARPADCVGGDWLVAMPVPGGRTAFTVGDVMGHGMPAAVLMGVLRSAIQALAPTQLDPAQVLRQLDDLAVQFQADRPQQEKWLATCLYGLYDPVTGICELAAAGHPPPVLTGADGASSLLPLEPGTPLGVGYGHYRTTRVRIAPGSQLVLYTDGVVEVRGRDLQEGMSALRDRASAGRHRPLDQLCQHLLDQVEFSDHPDDLALLVLRFPGLPAGRAVTWTFAADPGLSSHAGWLTDRALRRWGLDRAARTVVPVVDRLAADVARYGAGPMTLRLVYGAALLCEIGDTAGHLPGGPGRRPRPLDGFTESWGAYRTATGRVVWFERPLTG